MCGICGTISQAPLVDSDSVGRMHDALRHRGPDGEGVFDDAHVSLAMRRLAIIDPLGGRQPLFNEDRSLVLIANGEIYNFIELRDQLQGRGHRFRTGSDCETILHLYEEYGSSCVDHLRGMFAFVLWDSKRRLLLLARDRMGEKPLYLYEQKGRLTFASELKALLRAGVVPLELDPVAVDGYFHFGYVPEPQTPVAGVRKLPAACTLTVEVDPWKVTQRCYWQLEDAPLLDGDPAELIRSELDQIGRLLIRSDVPVGVALSAGLDSSAIAALSAREYGGEMHAFCVGYPGHPSYDERNDARKFADYLGMPFHEVELATEEMASFFPRLVHHRDDPIADISGYGYYAVAARAKEHGVSVLLQGQGGDELFWGYSWVSEAVRRSERKRLGLSGGRSPQSMVFYELVPHFCDATKLVDSLYAPAFRDQLDGSRPSDRFTFDQPWPRVDLRITRLICDLYLRENGIAQGDRLSMASSVELRLPLVDHCLVETVVGLRKARPDYGLEPKAWLKAALKGIVPDWVLHRPKQGFAPPLGTWHRALFERYGSWLSDGFLVGRGVLKAEEARELAGGPFPEGIVIPLSFKALVLETWCRSMSSEGGTTGESITDAGCAVCL